MAQGHSPNEKSSGTLKESALSAACGEASPESVQLLLAAGASIDFASVDEDAILSAVYGRSLECVKLLVDAGGDFHRTYPLEDGRLRNALEYAEWWGCPDIADYLRGKGAVLPSGLGDAGGDATLTDNVLSALANWFSSEPPKSLGSIGLGEGFGSAELYSFDMSTMDFPFQTVVTCGLSEHLVGTPAFGEETSRIELMIHLPFTWPIDGDQSLAAEYQWPLGLMRLLPPSILDGTFSLPGTHVIVSNNEPPEPLGVGTEQTCLLLIADFYEIFPIEVDDSKRVHFYHVVPLHTEERDFEKANGVIALLDAMSVHGLESLVVRPDRERFI